MKPQNSKEVSITHCIQYGIGVPGGEVAKTPEEAESIAKRLGMHSSYTTESGSDSFQVAMTWSSKLRSSLVVEAKARSTMD